MTTKARARKRAVKRETMTERRARYLAMEKIRDGQEERRVQAAEATANALAEIGRGMGIYADANTKLVAFCDEFKGTLRELLVREGAP